MSVYEGSWRGKARQRVRGILIVSLISALVASGLVLLATRALAPTGGNRAGLQASIDQAMPATFIGATSSSGSAPGAIDIVSTADGHVVRRIATTSTQYADNGLSRDGSASVYFDRFTSPSGKVEIAVVSLAGGPVTDVVEGIDPALSTDGRYLGYVPAGLTPAIGVLDLQTGEDRTISLAAELAGYQVAWDKGLAWLDHDTKLAVLAYKSGVVAQSCPALVVCSGSPSAPSVSRLVILALTSASATLSSVITSQPNERWTFLAAGNQGQDVVVFESGDNSRQPGSRFLEAAVGSNQWRTLAATPAGIFPVSLDSTATHLLYMDGASLNAGTISDGSLIDVRSIPGAFVTASW